MKLHQIPCYIALILSIFCLNTKAAQPMLIPIQGNEELQFWDTAPLDFQDLITYSSEIDWVYHTYGTDQAWALSSQENRLYRFDTQTLSQNAAVTICSGATAVAQAPHGDRVFVSCPHDQEVFAYIPPNFELGTGISLSSQPKHLFLAEHINRLFISHEDGDMISVINTQSLQLIQELPLTYAAGSIAFLPDQTKMLISFPDLNQVKLFDSISLQEIESHEVGQMPDGLDVSADGKWLAVSHLAEDNLWLVPLAAPQQTIKVAVDHSPSWPVFSEYGNVVYVTSKDMDSITRLAVSATPSIQKFDLAGHQPSLIGKPLARSGVSFILKNGFEELP